jgi:hypothetical protein
MVGWIQSSADETGIKVKAFIYRQRSNVGRLRAPEL